MLPIGNLVLPMGNLVLACPMFVPKLRRAAAIFCHIFCLQKQAHEHEEALTSKTQERDLHEETVESTRSQVTSLHEQRDVAAQEAAAAQALIRDKADAAKVERER